MYERCRPLAFGESGALVVKGIATRHERVESMDIIVIENSLLYTARSLVQHSWLSSVDAQVQRKLRADLKRARAHSHLDLDPDSPIEPMSWGIPRFATLILVFHVCANPPPSLHEHRAP